MAGLAFGIGKMLSNYGGVLADQQTAQAKARQAQQELLLKQQDEDLKKRAEDRAQKSQDLQDRYTTMMLAHPDWNAPAGYQTHIQKIQDNLEKAKSFYHSAMAETDPTRREGFTAMGDAITAGQGEDYIRGLGEHYGIIGKPSGGGGEDKGEPAFKDYLTTTPAGSMAGYLKLPVEQRAKLYDDWQLKKGVGIHMVNITGPDGAIIQVPASIIPRPIPLTLYPQKECQLRPVAWVCRAR